jgi:hypothetical protein
VAVAVLTISGILLLQSKEKSKSYFGEGNYVDYAETSSSVASGQGSATTADKGSSDTNQYMDSKFNFRVNLPQDIKATFLDEGDSRTVLLKGGGYDMQIYVSPFDEDISITPERIKRDIPDMKIESSEYVTVDGQIKALAFISTDDQGQKFREVWFVRDQHLYQILSPASADLVTGKIMQSWKWQK